MTVLADLLYTVRWKALTRPALTRPALCRHLVSCFEAWWVRRRCADVELDWLPDDRSSCRCRRRSAHSSEEGTRKLRVVLTRPG